MEHFFLQGSAGRLYCVYHAAPTPLPGRPALLHLPAFAEEMNKSRRMVSLAARALAANGIASLVLDPYGTGDSEGEFGDADWRTWLDDGATALAELQRRGHLTLGLWGLRTGCLMAAELVRDVGATLLLCWQPVVSGEQFLNQFLRLRVAGARLRGDEGESVKELRAEIDAGKSIEVTGYDLSPGLCAGMASANLQQTQLPGGCSVIWLEVNAVGAEPGLAAQGVLKAWREGGATVEHAGIAGEPFWGTQEISTAPALINATILAVGRELAS